MKEWIKVVVIHFFIITVGVLFFTSIEPFIENGFSGEYIYPAYYPFMVIFVGFTGAIPSLLFYFRKEPTRKQFFIRTVIHFITIVSIVMTEGYLFEWYDKFFEGLMISLTIFIVYVFVWFSTLKLDLSLAKDINDALKRINDDEDE